MFTAAVLMSTYNGENYLREQIDSILNQEAADIRLFVRDDGSADKTIEMIEDCMKRQENITLFKGRNIGVGNSFMDLLYQAGDEFDYYAFADQDDIWLPFKLRKAVEKIGQQDRPILYASNQILADKELNRIGLRYTQAPDTGYTQIMCQNKITGCTMVWNRALQRLLSDPKRRPSKELLAGRIHDVWVAMAASVAGGIIYDQNGYILYRQHENNVVGIRKANVMMQWIDKMRHPEQRNGRSLLCKEIVSKYADVIPSKEIITKLNEFAYYSDNVKSKIKLLRDNTVINCTGETRIGFMMKVLFNFF
ncbi:glycosyltransferase [Clostridiaceae bacterium]|nr:glycosyltransferase [Clostridiaceae bacterium]